MFLLINDDGEIMTNGLGTSTAQTPGENRVIEDVTKLKIDKRDSLVLLRPPRLSRLESLTLAAPAGSG
jgi:hypothetical protein